MGLVHNVIKYLEIYSFLPCKLRDCRTWRQTSPQDAYVPRSLDRIFKRSNHILARKFKLRHIFRMVSERLD